MTDIQKYVAGFLFNTQGDKLALVLKNRPEWQAGSYNAIGGKVEPNESVEDAMQREFLEETGVDLFVGQGGWRQGPMIQGQEFEVHFFYAFNDMAYDVKTIEDEPIHLVDSDNLPSNVIPNLRWLVPLIMDSSLNKAGLVLDYGRKE